MNSDTPALAECFVCDCVVDVKPAEFVKMHRFLCRWCVGGGGDGEEYTTVTLAAFIDATTAAMRTSRATRAIPVTGEDGKTVFVDTGEDALGLSPGFVSVSRHAVAAQLRSKSE